MLLNDDRLGRALEQFVLISDTVRSELMLKAIDRFGIDAGRLHLDLTCIPVAGAFEDSTMVAKGWGPTGVKRQAKLLCATNPKASRSTPDRSPATPPNSQRSPTASRRSPRTPNPG